MMGSSKLSLTDGGEVLAGGECCWFGDSREGEVE